MDSWEGDKISKKCNSVYIGGDDERAGKVQGKHMTN